MDYWFEYIEKFDLKCVHENQNVHVFFSYLNDR